MRIAHLALSSFYIDNYNYQENMLPLQNKLDGHEVLIIASTLSFDSLYRCEYVKPSEYINENGIRTIRIPYRKIFTNSFTHKIRAYRGVEKILKSFSPDVIFFHGMCSYDLITVSKYVKKNNEVRFYVDTHADKDNSGRGFLSEYILHRLIYKFFYKIAEPNINRLFFISYDTKTFAEKMYHPDRQKMHYLPLGGFVLKDECQYSAVRSEMRFQLGLSDDDIVFIHSGKFNRLKKSIELFRAFSNAAAQKIKLLVVGEFSDEVAEESLSYISSNDNIIYVGWKKPDELTRYLCASDIYIQPGTQSATMQNAICNRCAVALTSCESHTYLLGNSAFYIDSEEDMKSLFVSLSGESSLLNDKRKQCWRIAVEKLDYSVIAKEIYI